MSTPTTTAEAGVEAGPLVCRRCGDAAGPFTIDGLCEDCALADVLPGVYGIQAEEYHADPIPGGSLSSTGARRLLECPARFRYLLDHPEPYKPAYEYGTAAHTVVLGDGPELVVVDAARWDTNETKTLVRELRAAGKVPLKKATKQKIDDMAAVLAADPEAADLFAPGSGEAEQSLFWPDPRFGVWRRARPDWLRPDRIVDYKTVRSARPEDLRRAFWEHGYGQQQEWYRDGAAELGILPRDAPFTFVCQEKEPPYVVTVVELDFFFAEAGRHLTERALARYVECRETGHWPGYVTGTTYLSMPPWAERELQEN
ncbi:PD-(D/E)XK nuclease-like domain-containing protein [Streptomyces sp. NPDC006798]|uniref:PD-(D/E)XK nuclease-like domain-containing protein n=1 Tax=unclassified Streptomyces TaxID=2593676 RepID=UPI00332A029B